MTRRDFVDRTAVTRYRRFPAAAHPGGGVHATHRDRLQHDLVVSAQRDHAALLLQFDQLIDHIAGVRSAIDVIADEDQFIIGADLQCRDERTQRLATPVNVPNHVTCHENQFSPGSNASSSSGKERSGRKSFKIARPQRCTNFSQTSSSCSKILSASAGVTNHPPASSSWSSCCGPQPEYP